MTRDRIRIYFDGGCRPNPGNMETAVVVRGETHMRHDVGHGDSSDAEWRALLHAVEVATSLGIDNAEFIGDSMLVVRQARGELKCRSPELRAYLAAYQAAIKAMTHVRLRHVRRSKNMAGLALYRARRF